MTYDAWIGDSLSLLPQWAVACGFRETRCDKSLPALPRRLLSK